MACEGPTEVEYFQRLSKLFGAGVVLKAVHGGRKSDPGSVLELARRHRQDDRDSAREAYDRADVFDAVWIVVDVDQHAHLADALRQAEKDGIEAAVSQPCFEVWLILHRKDCTAPFDSAQVAKKAWKELLGDAKDFRLIDLAGVADAIGRGKALAQIHERNHVERLRRNPSTEVGRLAEQVWAACDAQRSTRQRAG